MSEEQFRTLFENSLDAMVIADDNGQYLDVNGAACALFGYSRDQMLAMRVGDLITPQAPGAAERYQAYLQAGREVGEFIFRRADGEVRIASYSACCVAPGRHLSILRDVTPHRQSEEHLRREKRFTDAVLDSLPGIFYVFDTAGRFLRWNKNFETVTGYTAEEIAHLHPIDFFGGEDRDLIARRIQEVFEQGEATAEAEMVSKDGRRTPFFFTGKLTLLEDQVCLVGMGVDVSERKRLEAELAHAQRIESIGRLAGGIAHDFNNLLSVILGYAELVEMELTTDGVVRTGIRNIQTAATRAATLTRQLLGFARRQVMQPKVINLNTLLREIGALLKPLIGEQIELILHPQAARDAVRVDPGQIEQVIMNLVVNARDAMPQGGKLLLQTAEAVLADTYLQRDITIVPGTYVMLSVSDTGSGMTEEVKAHLFEPFFTTKEVGKGAGLGLATCYGIVKQNQGYIWAYSEVGLGTTVKVYLPLFAEPASPSEALLTPEESQEGSETILVVEDEPLVRELAVNTLRRHGYTILEAGNGREALEVAARYRGPIHLLLTDVVMPQMSGAVLVRNLQCTRPESRILYASGYTEEAISIHGVLPAQTALIQKPFSSRMLLKKVREVLER